MGLFRALMQSLSKQDPCINQPQLFEFYFCGQQILHLPFRRWTRTSECFAEFTAPVSPLFMPSWHFELLYRLLPFRLFFWCLFGLLFGGWFVFFRSLLGRNLAGNSLFTRLR